MGAVPKSLRGPERRVHDPRRPGGEVPRGVELLHDAFSNLYAGQVVDKFATYISVDGASGAADQCADCLQ